MPMSEQNAVNMEELWTTRRVKEGKRLLATLKTPWNDGDLFPQSIE